MWCTCTDHIKCRILFDRYVRSLREITTQCECSLQWGNKSLSEQCPNLQDLWFSTSWLQSGNEKGWTGGSWCQIPFMGFWLLGLRASTDSSAAVQPGFRELFEEELWEALAEAIPLYSGAALNLGNCPCSLSGVHCIHAGTQPHSSLIWTWPTGHHCLAQCFWTSLRSSSAACPQACSVLIVQVLWDVSVRPLPCCPWPGSPPLQNSILLLLFS